MKIGLLGFGVVGRGVYDIVADLRGWTATLGLRHGPDSYGRQQ